MLKTIVLICSTSLEPSACTPATAIDAMTFPPQPGAMCAFAGMATLAGTALKPGPGQYLKVVCVRQREAAR